jgi:hypothetical protein
MFKPEWKRGDAFCPAQFDFADGFSCIDRVDCTRTVRGPRQSRFLPRVQRETVHRARGQLENAPWQATYAYRAGIDGPISEAV